MKIQSRLCSLLLFLYCVVGLGTAARAEQVGKIRLTDRGPFQVWNGIDADAPLGSGNRVLAVIGTTKSLRVTYAATMNPPQVKMGQGWVDVLAGSGTAMTFSGPDRDCYPRTILLCKSGPIGGIPPGAILCMCTGSEDTICCTSDTGIYYDNMIPREGAY